MSDRGYVVEVRDGEQWVAEEWHAERVDALFGMRQYIQDMDGTLTIGPDIRVHWVGNCFVCEGAAR